MNKEPLMDIFNSALIAADPYQAVMTAVRVDGNRMRVGGREYDLASFDRIMVIGAGKGTAAMARAVEELLGEKISDGVIVVKYGHTRHLRVIRQVEASHPLPDEAGVEGTRQVLDTASGLDEKSLVICLLSGGGSALLVSPCEGITLGEKRAATDLLLRAGAPIGELNAVRKHLSRVKGGRLAELVHPAAMVTLILSDVIGDRLDVIASGPTVPDGSTFADAVRAVEKYDMREKMPVNVMRLFDEGLSGRVADTPKPGAPCFAGSTTVVVGSLDKALASARGKAEELGYHAEIITTELEGDTGEAARYLADIARKSLLSKAGPMCILAGGETTVAVKGNGKGGRNQEMALIFAMEMDGEAGVTFLSGGTDGTDGPTDAAGAVVDGDTAALARRLGLDPAQYLEDNDSYHFFRSLDELSGERHHLVTGPTGTNVMDVQIILVQGGL